MSRQTGFPGQRLVVIPAAHVERSRNSPITRQLMPTDVGYFPRARAHGVDRGVGVPGVIVLACTSGSGWCTVRGARHLVSAGQVVTIPPGEPHAYGASSDDPWTLWWLHATGEQVGALLTSGAHVATQPVRTISDIFHAVSLIGEIIELLESNPTSQGQLSAAGAVWHLMSILATAVTSRPNNADMIEAVRQRILDRPDGTYSVAEMARLSDMSESHFAALFRQIVGTPMLRYQTSVRMARARALLDTTDDPVAIVAERSGYRDPFYFSRQFGALHGMTPREYRRQQKG